QLYALLDDGSDGGLRRVAGRRAIHQRDLRHERRRAHPGEDRTRNFGGSRPAGHHAFRLRPVGSGCGQVPGQQIRGIDLILEAGDPTSGLAGAFEASPPRSCASQAGLSVLRSALLGVIMPLLTLRKKKQPLAIEPVASAFPVLRDAEIAAAYAGQRSAGDFYDSFRGSPSRVLFDLLDVAGRRAQTQNLLAQAQAVSRTAGAQ